MLLTYTALFKDGAPKHKQRIERRIFCGKRPFRLNDFSHVRQIACRDRFACVLLHMSKRNIGKGMKLLREVTGLLSGAFNENPPRSANRMKRMQSTNTFKSLGFITILILVIL